MFSKINDPPPPYPGNSNPGDIKGSQPDYPGGGNPPHYGTHPSGFSQPYSQSTNVIVTQPVIRLVQTYNESPVRTTCPHCRAEVLTGIQYETGTVTWVICCVLLAMGCLLGCCFIPFCLNAAKDVLHICPNCQQQIARYNRM